MDDAISRAKVLNLVKDVCDAILSGCGSHYDGEDEVYDNPLEVDAILKCNKEIRTALKHLPSVQRWIPCSERLPEPGEYYLVTRKYFGWNCTEYREIDIAKYDFDGWPKAYTVLAWCELPEPYKEDADD